MTTVLEDINDVLEQWCEDVVKQIKSNLDSTGTTASGRTKESVVYEVKDGSLVIYGRKHFDYVEKGRPPGKTPYNFKDILFQWASDKGILSSFGKNETEQKSTLFIVGEFIKKSGTKLYRNGGRKDIYTDVLESELPELEKKVVFNVKQTILNKI